MSGSLASIKVALIHTTPNTDTTAVAIEVNKLALVTSEGAVLVSNIMSAAADSVMMMMRLVRLSEPSALTAEVGLACPHWAPVVGMNQRI